VNDHPNAALVRKYLEAMTTGDMQVGAEMLSDDIEWHEIGRADAIRGKAALAERFGMGSGTAPSYEITGETHDVIANDDHTIALLTAHAIRGGETLDYKVAEIYHVRDGKISGRWAFSDDTEAINAFFKGE
jgi:ketosteroid isomerase-like protein